MVEQKHQQPLAFAQGAEWLRRTETRATLFAVATSAEGEDAAGET